MYMKRIIPALTVMVLWAGLQFAGTWAETLKIITDPMATALILAGSLAALSSQTRVWEWRTVQVMLAAFVVAGALLAFGQFIPGIATFAVAHLVYIGLSVARIMVGFRRKSPPVGGDILKWGWASSLVTAIALVVLVPQIARFEMKTAVIVYGVIIAASLACAMIASSSLAEPRWRLSAYGAMALFSSDLLLAFMTFGGIAFVGAGHLVMATYWAGLLLITRSAEK